MFYYIYYTYHVFYRVLILKLFFFFNEFLESDKNYMFYLLVIFMHSKSIINKIWKILISTISLIDWMFLIDSLYVFLFQILFTNVDLNKNNERALNLMKNEWMILKEMGSIEKHYFIHTSAPNHISRNIIWYGNRSTI